MAVRCRLIGGSFGWSFGGLRSTGILSFSERLKCVRTACQACRRHASAWRCFPSPFLSEFCAKTRHPVAVTRGGGWVAQESVDGKYLYYSRDGPGRSLWRMTVAGAQQEMIDENLSYATNFDVTSEGVYFITRHGQRQIARLKFFDARTNKTTTLLDTGKHWGSGITVAPNGHEILYSVMDFYATDLMYLDRIP